MATVTISTSICLRRDNRKSPNQPRPIWGVLTQPVNSEERLVDFQTYYREYIPASFVRWLESGGARVIPIRYDVDEQELRRLFESVNGILFTGGEITDISNTPYGKNARLLFQWAVEANDSGDHFPLYGTCQGFQLLSQLAADNFTLKRRVKGCVGVSLPLEFTPKARSSRIFGSLPDHVYHTLRNTPCGEHMHNYCIPPEAYKEYLPLGDMFDVLATNRDAEGKIFVTSMEGKNYPFWGGQFHPERNGWEWTDKEDIDHSAEAIVAMHHLAVFLVNESRKSKHRFTDEDEEQALLIHNRPSHLLPTERETSMYMQTYFWGFEDEPADRKSVV